jgi:hypothetical protein
MMTSSSLLKKVWVGVEIASGCNEKGIIILYYRIYRTYTASDTKFYERVRIFCRVIAGGEVPEIQCKIYTGNQ